MTSRRTGAEAREAVLVVADLIDLAIRRLGPDRNAEDALAFVRLQLSGWGEGRLDPAQVREAAARAVGVLVGLGRTAEPGAFDRGLG